mmetsp:Transcript_38090/g.65786  ORF Transcript_38090/g.65786 Transcript_38090/m.65786 type:complete len:205 (+) Transcript_38090:327-941(+)
MHHPSHERSMDGTPYRTGFIATLALRLCLGTSGPGDPGRELDGLVLGDLPPFPLPPFLEPFEPAEPGRLLPPSTGASSTPGTGSGIVAERAKMSASPTCMGPASPLVPPSAPKKRMTRRRFAWNELAHWLTTTAPPPASVHSAAASTGRSSMSAAARRVELTLDWRRKLISLSAWSTSITSRQPRASSPTSLSGGRWLSSLPGP